MYKILYNMYYKIMTVFVNIEVFWNIFINRFFVKNVSIDACIVLVDNNEEDDGVIILENLDDDIKKKYDFGFVEKNINNKICNFLFNELDTNDIPHIFSEPIENIILSVDIELNEKTTYPLDFSKYNLCFKQNILFFQNHIIYLMKIQHGIKMTSDDNYNCTIIDNNCNIVKLNKTNYLLLESDDKKLYKIINI